MHHPHAHAPVAVLLGLALAGAAGAQESSGQVYQWKDANGVTHYSQDPPPQGTYTTRRITHGAAAPAPVADRTADAAAPPPPGSAAASTTAGTVPAPPPAPDDAKCTTARANLEALQSDRTLRQDTDGDGTLDKTLTDADRVEQRNLAGMAEKAFCRS